MKREKIREKTFKIVYQMTVTGNYDYASQNIIDEDADVLNEKQAVRTLEAVRDHIEEIDAVIQKNLDRWNYERTAKTDLAILITAVAEIMYLDDIPAGVSINEAVNLAKKYGEEKSYAFVNSVLAKINREING